MKGKKKIYFKLFYNLQTKIDYILQYYLLMVNGLTFVFLVSNLLCGELYLKKFVSWENPQY